jgi:hypothetical protein
VLDGDGLHRSLTVGGEVRTLGWPRPRAAPRRYRCLSSLDPRSHPSTSCGACCGGSVPWRRLLVRADTTIADLPTTPMAPKSPFTAGTRPHREPEAFCGQWSACR